MPTVHVYRCGECGSSYSWPLYSSRVWVSMWEGQKRYFSECPHCGRVSALRFLKLELQHPLEQLMEMLQRVVTEHASDVSHAGETDAEVRSDDVPDPHQ